MKLSAEAAQLAFAGSEQSKGRLYLDFANSRLLEAREVPLDRVDRALRDMDGDIVAGAKALTTAAVAGDRSALDTLRDFVSAQQARLTAFTAAVPGSSAAAARSFGVLRDVGARADGIAVALRGGCPFATADGLGPKPATGC